MCELQQFLGRYSAIPLTHVFVSQMNVVSTGASKGSSRESLSRGGLNMESKNRSPLAVYPGVA